MNINTLKLDFSSLLLRSTYKLPCNLKWLQIDHYLKVRILMPIFKYRAFTEQEPLPIEYERNAYFSENRDRKNTTLGLLSFPKHSLTFFSLIWSYFWWYQVFFFFSLLSQIVLVVVTTLGRISTHSATWLFSNLILLNWHITIVILIPSIVLQV